jgi:hypothetical protein
VGGLFAPQRKMAPRRERVSSLGRLPLSLLLLLLPLLLGPRPAASHGGKYSREKNEPEPTAKREAGEEFRMEKLNQLWEKARRVSGGGREREPGLDGDGGGRAGDGPASGGPGRVSPLLRPRLVSAAGTGAGDPGVEGSGAGKAGGRGPRGRGGGARQGPGWAPAAHKPHPWHCLLQVSGGPSDLTCNRKEAQWRLRLANAHQDLGAGAHGAAVPVVHLETPKC